MIKDLAICGSISVSTEIDTIYTTQSWTCIWMNVLIPTYELKDKMMNFDKY